MTFVRLVLWNLADAQTTVAELRRHLADELARVPAEVGLRLRAWISDEGTERWGAVELWESRAAAERSAVSRRVLELIGKNPEVGEEFDVEATVEGEA